MPAPTTYSSEELRAQRAGLSIYGQLFLPKGARARGGDRLPTVAAGHGFGANYLHVVPYAWALAERGYAVYCFDFCGGGYASRSDGNPIDMSPRTERDDYLAVIDMLRGQDVVDKDNLFLLGEDLGGLVATMAAHDRPDEVKGLVLLYPSFQLHDDTRRLFPTTKNIPVSYRQLGMRVGRGFGQAAWETNPYTFMRDYPGDVLIAHGDEDATCLIEYSERAVEVFPSARLQTIHGGKHGFRDKPLAKALAAIEGFLDDETRADERADETAAPATHLADEKAAPARSASIRPRYNPDYVAQTVRGRHFRQARGD